MHMLTATEASFADKFVSIRGAEVTVSPMRQFNLTTLTLSYIRPALYSSGLLYQIPMQ